MAGTDLVLVMLLSTLLCPVIALAVTFSLARRNHQALKKMSLSLRHGFTAEFFPRQEDTSERKT
jgi:hypothetical protein